MNYSPIKCPSCGSGAIVPAEGQRIYCKSCDQYSERTKAEPKPASVPTSVRLAPEEEIHFKHEALALLVCIAWLVFILTVF